MGYDYTVYKGSKDGSIKNQVLVRVTHSGVCFTVVHYRLTDMALGHGGAGVGSFASHAVWPELFLFKVPDAIMDEDSAPLMCGVGIIGVGGLGHLAIQFAVKMGCQVVVFSGSDTKKDEAKKLGATGFYATKGVKELKVPQKLDNLIVTTSSQPNWNLYINLLNPGATTSPLTVQSSIVSARQIHRDMLDFAAFHGIKPVNMSYPLTKDGIEDCLKTLEDGRMRYRGVLVTQ
ncbi:uncharacterized protein BDW43DRAFT_300390 [Aspergillus alliaceus]|uniref:uncharacterized protein n=1 Tax=Petromyces alliaceus TaxID=209559 RepID=UPI0012A43491|nr:uncharacterized protein BDW43DRAFT_300390 [Aspergillus alliaceus]KAB8233198.1 hypothetical protein BDW43DRAFT_300390 [Aspergillus alliaceus]